MHLHIHLPIVLALDERADTLVWHVLILCGHCVRMCVHAGETCTRISGGGGTRMDGRDGTQMDDCGGTLMDGGGEKSLILAPIKNAYLGRRIVDV